MNNYHSFNNFKYNINWNCYKVFVINVANNLEDNLQDNFKIQ